MMYMRKIIHGLWRIVTFPFRILRMVAVFPSKAFKRAQIYMTEEPTDRPLADVFATTVKQPSALLEHVDVLPKHLTRMVSRW